MQRVCVCVCLPDKSLIMVRWGSGRDLQIDWYWKRLKRRCFNHLQNEDFRTHSKKPSHPCSLDFFCMWRHRTTEPIMHAYGTCHLFRGTRGGGGIGWPNRPWAHGKSMARICHLFNILLCRSVSACMFVLSDCVHIYTHLHHKLSLSRHMPHDATCSRRNNRAFRNGLATHPTTCRDFLLAYSLVSSQWALVVRITEKLADAAQHIPPAVLSTCSVVWAFI
jgi:hypothetical protein